VRRVTAGDAVIEAHGLLRSRGRLPWNGVIHPRFAVHAHHAEIERIVGREAAAAEQCHGNVELASANELLEGFIAPEMHDAVPGKNQRTLGGIEEFDCAIEFGFVE